MVFYIFDQGARISTPVDAILRKGGTEPVAKSDRLHPVRGHEDRAAIAADEYREQQIAERRMAVYAEQIMSRPVITIPAQSPLEEGWQLIAQHGVHYLPVVNELGELEGMLSDRDLFRLAVTRPDYGAAGLKVANVMSTRVVTAAPEAEIRLLAEVMVGKKLGAIPIVQKSVPIGIVTRSDILRAVTHHAPLELWV